MRKKLLSPWTAALIVAAPAVANGPLWDVSKSNVTFVPEAMCGVAAYDANADGRNDLVLVGRTTLAYGQNDGSGGFTFSTQSAPAGLVFVAGAVAAADNTGAGGTPDAVVGAEETATNLAVVVRATALASGSPTLTPVVLAPHEGVLHLDADAGDVLVSTGGSPVVPNSAALVHVRDDDSYARINTDGKPSRARFTDLDGDGVRDAVSAGLAPGGGVVVDTYQRTASFLAPQARISLPASGTVSDLVADDPDGSGRANLHVFVGDLFSGTTTIVSLVPNAGATSLYTAASYTVRTTTLPEYVAEAHVGDFEDESVVPHVYRSSLLTRDALDQLTLRSGWDLTQGTFARTESLVTPASFSKRLAVTRFSTRRPADLVVCDGASPVLYTMQGAQRRLDVPYPSPTHSCGSADLVTRNVAGGLIGEIEVQNGAPFGNTAVVFSITPASSYFPVAAGCDWGLGDTACVLFGRGDVAGSTLHRFTVPVSSVGGRVYVQGAAFVSGGPAFGQLEITPPRMVQVGDC